MIYLVGKPLDHTKAMEQIYFELTAEYQFTTFVTVFGLCWKAKKYERGVTGAVTRTIMAIVQRTDHALPGVQLPS